MTVVFRVDASLETGTGHLMRCITLAEALRDRGEGCLFVTRDAPDALSNLPGDRGFDTVLLPQSEVVLSQESDAEATITVLAEAGVDPFAVVVDEYEFDYRWEVIARAYAGRIVVIDDLANRRHECDLLLDQNLYDDPGSRYSGLVPERTKLLLGPEWALLRREFADAARAPRDRDGYVRRVLISYGGTDPTNETPKALKSLSLVDDVERIDVVVGAGFTEVAEIQSVASEDSRVCIHVEANAIAALMCEADLALGAGGSTTWERCISGLPTVVTAVASNQLDQAKVLAERGAIAFLGISEDVSSADMSRTINELVGSPHSVKAMSASARALMGSCPAGASGVAKAILEVARGSI